MIIAQEQDEKDLVKEIENSNVICLVYSVDDEKTVERVILT